MKFAKFRICKTRTAQGGYRYDLYGKPHGWFKKYVFLKSDVAYPTVVRHMERLAGEVTLEMEDFDHKGIKWYGF